MKIEWEETSLVGLLVILAILVGTGAHRKSRWARITVVAICAIWIVALIHDLFFSVHY